MLFYMYNYVNFYFLMKISESKKVDYQEKPIIRALLCPNQHR